MEGLSPGQPGGGSGQYEFSEVENFTIARTAKMAKVWGVFALLIGVLTVVAIVVALAFSMDIAWEMGVDPTYVTGFIAALLPLAIVNLVIGWLYIASGNSLRKVVDTAGNDVTLMLSGLNRLANAFMIEAIVTVVALIGGVIFGIALAAGTEVQTW
jgi:hypothetical protein